MLGYFRISSNAVYPFTAGGKVCFLRLAPVDEKVEGDILGELEFIRYLRGQGYPALMAVASVSGEELLRLETVYGCFYESVFEGVDGVQMVDSGYPREAVYAYGRALGRLHALSAAYVPWCGSGRMRISWNGYGKSWRSTEDPKGRGRSLKR